MNLLSRCRPLLGTFVEVSVSENVSDKALIDLSSQAFEEIDRIQCLMSFHDDTSELSALNKTAHITPHMISKDMWAVLSQALSLSALTDGLFDVSIGQELVAQGSLPNHLARRPSTGTWKDIVLDEEQIFFKQPLLLDLGGIAKGYAVDCALKKLAGATSARVNAGGDLACTDWQTTPVTIRNPQANGMGVTFPMCAPAVATSGCYFQEARSVMIDPHTRKPVERKESVSVFAPTCMLADALTKIAYLDEHSSALMQQLNAQAVSIDGQGNVTMWGAKSDPA